MKDIAYTGLNKFIGNWKTHGVILADDGPEIEIVGTDSYEWLPGDYFLLHTADVLMGNERSQTHEIIGYDKNAGHYTMQYYNNRGESGNMIARLDRNQCTFESPALRFAGEFNEDGRVLSGNWQKPDENGVWVNFIKITLTKQND